MKYTLLVFMIMALVGCSDYEHYEDPNKLNDSDSTKVSEATPEARITIFYPDTTVTVDAWTVTEYSDGKKVFWNNIKGFQRSTTLDTYIEYLRK